MKFRYESVAIFLCGVFAFSSSSPAGKKDLLSSGDRELEKKINPSISDAEGTDDTDDLLARAKKSSTTTFCVEIKPGNDQPTVVVCDPSKPDQVHIPKPHPAPAPAPPPVPLPVPVPPPDTPIYYNSPSIDDLIPQYQPEYQPSYAYEPVVVVPPPQILPQILQPYSQPQVILLGDLNGCPSTNPSIISSFLQPNQLYASRSFEYPLEAANLWRGVYSPGAEAFRSVPGVNTLNGMWGSAYSNPLNVIDNQQNQLTNMRTLAPGASLINGKLSPEAQFNKQFLIQCNPSLTPIPSTQYAAPSSSGKANDQDPKTMNMESLGPGHQSQFMYPSPDPRSHGSYMNHQSMHHNKGQPMHNGQHYQNNMYPYNKPYNMHHKMMTPDAGAQERAAEGGQVGVKDGQEMSMQQGQSVTDSFAKIVSGEQLGPQNLPNPQSFNQGAFLPGGGSRTSPSDQKEQQTGSEKTMGGTQGSDNQFYSSSSGQGQNRGFASGDRIQMNVNGKDQIPQNQMGFSQSQQQQSSFVGGGGMQTTSDSKDQGFQKQMGFPQNQQQQKIIQSNPSVGASQPKSISDMPSYSQMLMQRMKAAVSQNNIQPFMVPSSDSTGNKSTQSKV